MQQGNADKSAGMRGIAFMLSTVIVLIAFYFFAGKTTFVLLLSMTVLFLIARGIAQGWYAQAVVLTGGVVFLLVTAFIYPEVAISKADSGSRLLNVFVSVKETFSQQAAGLGLTIMTIAGFSRYMNEIGASDKLVEICVVPLKKVKSRYMLLGLSYMVMQVLALFIPSASGLGLLMMATMYPVLRAVGCSKESVAAIIASGVCIDFGPAASSMIVGAEVAQVDLFGFFVYEQLPVAVFLIPFIGVMHMIVLRYWDKKAELKLAAGGNVQAPEALAEAEKKNVPLFYALLPTIPMFLLFVFSKLSDGVLPSWLRFQMDVVSALLLSFSIAFIFDILLTRNLKSSLAKVACLFDQMGKAFISIVSIILCAQVLANGMMKIGVINILFSMVPTGNHTMILTVVIFSVLIFLGSILLGTGTTFNAFASVAGEVAKAAGIPMAKILIPMQFASGFGRTLSPIAGIIIAVAGLVGISPTEIVKRNAIQLVSAFVLSMILSFIIN
jgi:DcuC family C4-dicarboxylate transporter